MESLLVEGPIPIPAGGERQALDGWVVAGSLWLRGANAKLADDMNDLALDAAETVLGRAPIS